MLDYCSVPYCDSKKETSGVTLHDLDLQEHWLCRIENELKIKWEYEPSLSENMKTITICSTHFVTNDFIFGKPIKLKSGVIPSIFPWTLPATVQRIRNRKIYPSVDVVTGIVYGQPQMISVQQILGEHAYCKSKIKSKNVTNNLNNHVDSKEVSIATQTADEEQTWKIAPEEIKVEAEEFDYKTMYHDLLHNMTSSNIKKETRKDPEDKETQTENDDISDTNQRPLFSIEHFIKDQKTMEYYTGFECFEIFCSSLEFLFRDHMQENMQIMEQQIDNVDKISRRDQYFLVLTKLRQNFGLLHLGHLFNLTSEEVSDIFSLWARYLYLKLLSLHQWPHRDILFKNTTDNKYGRTIGFIDVVEIIVQTTISIVTPSIVYSKNHNTLKGLIVTDSCGSVLFLSPLYAGSMPNEQIMKQCGFLTFLQHKVTEKFLMPDDVLLGEASYKIFEFLDPLRTDQINIPSFHLTGVPFLSDTVNDKPLFHKRPVARLKQYKILSHEVHESLLENFNQIYTVCALLPNFK